MNDWISEKLITIIREFEGKKMQWFSTKRFSPPCVETDYIVRNKFGIFIAQLEPCGKWIDSEGRYFEDDAVPTHFCVPYPIEAYEIEN